VNDKQAMTSRVVARVAAMTDEQKEARVQEIYAMPDDECTDEICFELYEIMLGGSSADQKRTNDVDGNSATHAPLPDRR
jgi:hypothetical protein